MHLNARLAKYYVADSRYGRNYVILDLTIIIEVSL